MGPSERPGFRSLLGTRLRVERVARYLAAPEPAGAPGRAPRPGGKPPRSAPPNRRVPSSGLRDDGEIVEYRHSAAPSPLGLAASGEPRSSHSLAVGGLAFADVVPMRSKRPRLNAGLTQRRCAEPVAARGLG